jgi:hypothetical protein
MLQSIKSIGRVSPDNARAIYAKSPTGRFPALDRNGHGGDGRGEAGEDEEMGLGAYLSWLVKKRLDGRFDNSRDWT